MSRKIKTAALALAVAGGVYLSGGTAEASNMGFKLERNFEVVPGFRNLYYVAYPLFNGLGDVGNANHTATTNQCVGDTAITQGPLSGDGNIDALDVLCDTWTDRGGPSTAQSFSVQYWVKNSCSSLLKGGTRGFGGISTTPTSPPFPLDVTGGYYIIATGTGATPPQNRSVIVGSHDPNRAPRPITASACAPRFDWINLPYHSMYQTSYEILCGLEGVDWEDGPDANSTPDDCWSNTAVGAPITTPRLDAANVPSGIFDGQNAISVQTWDNVPDGGPTDNQAVFSAVNVDFTGALVFPRPAFDLRPGDSYQVILQPTHIPTVFSSPHF